MGAVERGRRRALAAIVLAVAAWVGSSLGALAGPAVPTFSQRSAQWSHDALGSDRVDTIGSAGCALTAVTMVTAAYGYSTNPGMLNRWLTANGGYLENDLLLWRQAGAATQGSLRWRGLAVPGMPAQLRDWDPDIEGPTPQSIGQAQIA